MRRLQRTKRTARETTARLERQATARYVGRFAPTPSGPLHLGSLLTAVASFLDSRASEGTWLVRIDDLDEPRVDPSAEKEILSCLEAHGLLWDGDVLRQSDNREHYAAAEQQLQQQGLLFRCSCTRRLLRGSTRCVAGCRQGTGEVEHLSTRVICDAASVRVRDAVHGDFQWNFDEEDDFIVVRKDAFASYPLAVVVDDHLIDASHIVRGSDLLNILSHQIFLRERLQYREPKYIHIPIIVERGDIKLSKHTKAVAIDNRFATQNLTSVLQLLRMNPPAGLSIGELISYGIENWKTEDIPRSLAITSFMSI